MGRTLRACLAVLATVLLLTACSSAPMEKVAEAKNLIDSVVAAGGEEFAPKQVASIQKRYADSLTEIKYQDSLTFKNYATAAYTLNQLMDDCDLLRAKMAEAKGEPKITVAMRIKPGIDN